MRFFVIFVVFMCGVVSPVGAEPPEGNFGEGHERFHYWYKDLYKNGFSCCNDQDCRPTQSRSRDGHIEVMVDGEWEVVPPETILDKTAPDLGDHVCARKKDIAGYFASQSRILCVVLGKGV